MRELRAEDGFGDGLCAVPTDGERVRGNYSTEMQILWTTMKFLAMMRCALFVCKRENIYRARNDRRDSEVRGTLELKLASRDIDEG